MYDDIGYYGQDSPYWAYNQPGWKPCCVRCHKRKDDCKKYNSDQLGSFAGEWICDACLIDSDYKTPAQLVVDRKPDAMRIDKDKLHKLIEEKHGKETLDRLLGEEKKDAPICANATCPAYSEKAVHAMSSQSVYCSLRCKYDDPRFLDNNETYGD